MWDKQYTPTCCVKYPLKHVRYIISKHKELLFVVDIVIRNTFYQINKKIIFHNLLLTFSIKKLNLCATTTIFFFLFYRTDYIEVKIWTKRKRTYHLWDEQICMCTHCNEDWTDWTLYMNVVTTYTKAFIRLELTFILKFKWFSCLDLQIKFNWSFLHKKILFKIVCDMWELLRANLTTFYLTLNEHPNECIPTILINILCLMFNGKIKNIFSIERLTVIYFATVYDFRNGNRAISANRLCCRQCHRSHFGAFIINISETLLINQPILYWGWM